MTKRALGRGLDALLSPDASAGEATAAVVPIRQISPNPFQPRGEIEPDQLRELSESIALHGLIQPLVVAPTGSGYQLIAGERRWRAAEMAGLEEVPVVIRRAEPRDMLAVALIENIQRADLDPLEAAHGYRRLADEFGLTQDEVARLVGKSRAAVTNALRLLGLEPEIQAQIHRRELTEGHGRALLAESETSARLDLARASVRDGWSVRRLEEAVRLRAARPSRADKSGADGVAGGEPAPVPAAVDPNDAAAVKAMEAALGTRVELRRRGDGGTVIIHFYSAEELDELHRRMTAGG